MSVLSDKWIKKMALDHNMISPFIDKQIGAGKISYGLSSFGYDARVGDEFKIFHNVDSSIVDPKKFTSNNFVTKKNFRLHNYSAKFFCSSNNHRKI